MWFSFIFWGIIGLLISAAILTRIITVYALALIVSITTSSGNNLNRATKKMQKAFDFYPNGFKLIKNSFSNFELANIDDGNEEPIKWSEFLMESIWTIIFWGIIVMSLSILGGANIFSFNNDTLILPID